MATKTSLKMLEVCRVTPLSNSSTPLVEFTLPLTYFDMLWVKFLPQEQVFLYQLGQDESTHSFFNSVILPKLKHSLSLTLAHFFPIAGNIIWPVDTAKPHILYTPNYGVSLIVAESNSDLNHLSHNEMQEAADLHPYIPELPTFDSKAAMIAFQITFFPSQGFSIGITTHHAIFDAKSLAIFMKSWAHICKENFNFNLPPDLTPVFDRTLVDEPEGLSKFILSRSDPNYSKSLKLSSVIRDIGNLIRANFEISRQNITKLRRTIVSGEEKDMHLSTFVVSYAHIIVSMVKAKQLEKKGKVGFVIPADYRSRLNPPLPTNYFGYCVIGSFELSRMIKELEIRVKNMNTDREIENLLKFENIVEVADLIIGVSGSPRFGIYGSDFGWGKPDKFQIVSIDRGASISMVESRDGNGGIEVGLVLRKNEMDMFLSLFLDGFKDV
ncbi:phenolic glucoside malonyltransferase 1-like [Euphorbia lathyris]|uniref:phenolic glucoside malonyltransferase 1-like n=1 Tax=Euphorbia lathyris TaxID=212925 RepID=UPI0033141B25